MTIHVHQISCSGGGVPKMPVNQAEITTDGLAGDLHNNLKHHGGPNRAVCLFSLEAIQALQAEGHSIAPGSAGENLTLAGLPQPEWADLLPGSRLSIGDSVELEITKYTAPCHKITQYFLDEDSSRISQEKHPGWSRLYAKVLKSGMIRAGDAVRIIE